MAHNRGARESESHGDEGRSGSVAMTFVATALGPRVRPAAVAAGPRGPSAVAAIVIANEPERPPSPQDSLSLAPRLCSTARSLGA